LVSAGIGAFPRRIKTASNYAKPLKLDGNGRRLFAHVKKKISLILVNKTGGKMHLVKNN
jgi:hypothetical protein